MHDVQPGPARFDPTIRAWILSRHADVGMALREPCLAAGDSLDGPPAHIAVREAIAHSLSADRLAGMRAGLERSAHDLAASLPPDRPVDLVTSFGGPWSLSLAVTITGASSNDAEGLSRLAREVFLGAAFATDAGTREDAKEAAAELARRLPGAATTSNVQAFVALSQTLPHTLASAWLALFRSPAAAQGLRAEPDLMPRAVEELLRRSGPSRALFRHAVEDVGIGGVRIRGGDRVVLMLGAANRDPARFADPDRVDFHRNAGEHLAFGGGAHSCAGARLIRVAVAVATGALLRTTDAVELTGPVEWINGFAIRAPASLRALLRRTPRALQVHGVSGAG